MAARAELFLGPVDSGKSAFAEARALSLCAGFKPLYIATLPRTRAFQARISKHRAARGDSWHVLEIARSFDEIFTVPEDWLSGGILLDGLIAFIARRLQAAFASGRGLPQEGRALLREYTALLDWILPRAPLFFVVSNLAKDAPLAPVDLEILDANATLCSVTADRCEAVWLSAQGRTERIAWPEVLRLLKPGTKGRPTRGAPLG